MPKIFPFPVITYGPLDGMLAMTLRFTATVALPLADSVVTILARCRTKVSLNNLYTATAKLSSYLLMKYHTYYTACYRVSMSFLIKYKLILLHQALEIYSFLLCFFYNLLYC